MSPESKRQTMGRAGEDAAAAYLERAGYVILHRNYRAGRGEIDIVAKDGGTLVFVEVKSGRAGRYGDPLDRVDIHKQRQIARIASLYLAESGQDDIPCRFDVMDVRLSDGRCRILHLEDAFWMEDDGIES
ncbi:MAG TPA: YraN family protein [bacterium]|nr:YraN family protein [bacterium]